MGSVGYGPASWALLGGLDVRTGPASLALLGAHPADLTTAAVALGLANFIHVFETMGAAVDGDDTIGAMLQGAALGAGAAGCAEMTGATGAREVEDDDEVMRITSETGLSSRSASH